MNNILLKPNHKAITYEDFGEEVVIVKLDTGVYYSLNPTAVSIWRLLEANKSLDEIEHFLLTRYKADSTIIQKAFASFVENLTKEELVTVEDGEVSFTGLDIDILAKDQDQINFICPELQTYTDMQELLLLDPIHEVDDTGWPVANPSFVDQNSIQ